MASLDRARCAALEGEFSAAVSSYLAALERRAKVVGWQQIFLGMPDIECLDTLATERLLERIRTPPCEIRPEKRSMVAPIVLRLTADLDRLKLYDLFARIERLLEPQQGQL